MSIKYLVEGSNLSAIGGAIRQKNGSSTTYKPSEMAAAIAAISPQLTLQQKTANTNGTVTPDSGYDGLSQVTVNVPNSYAAADEGKVVSNGVLVAQTSGSTTQNGTVDTTLINSLVVNVSGGTVLINYQYYQNAGEPSFTYDRTFICETAGDYYIAAIGYLDSMTLKHNGSTIPKTDYSLYYSTSYIYFYTKTLSMSVGDSFQYSCSSSGRSAVVFLVIKV